MTTAFVAALLELDDYVSGHQSDADAAAFEEALFTRALADEAKELGFRAGLGATLKEMKARGTINVWLTRAQLAEVQSLGLKIAFYELDFANPQPPVIADDADLLITKIPVNLSGVRRLEAEVLTENGRILKRMPDIRFEASENAIFGCCEAELARTAAASALRITRFWGTNEAGQKLLLLELPGM